MLRAELSFPIKTYEIDFAGHVSNQVYIRWLEDLRLEMLRLSIPIELFLARGPAPILLRTEIDYLAQAHLPQTVAGAMWIESYSRARVTLGAEFKIVGTGEVAARARQVVCFIDLQRGRVIAVPAELKQLVEDPA